jgi:lipoyl synthase
MREVSESLDCYFPGRRFPAYSVTGGDCALNCAHCEGRLLHGMRPVRDPSALLAEAERLAGSGGTGFLLSGGCDGNGRVPLLPFAEAVRDTRRRWGLKANLHTGLLTCEAAKRLTVSEADCYSVDVHQSRTVISDVLHLDASPSSYRETLVALVNANIGPIVPHVTVGLDDDGTDAIESIELAAGFDLDGLVVLVFTPIKGTAMGDVRPPPDALVLDVLNAARKSLECPIALGCMRPRGNTALEIAAVKLGVREIAMPSRETMDWARDRGMKVKRLERCCAVHL